MHFVSAQTQEEQVQEVIWYFIDSLRESVKDPKSQTLAGAEDKLEAFDNSQDYSGLFDYLLTLRDDLITLPTSHSKSQLTIQRAILLLLPVIKIIEDSGKNTDKLRDQISTLCTVIEESPYNLTIKVNA